MNMLCLGLGYSARTLCARLAMRGWRIAGTARTSDGARRIAADGWQGIAYDATAPGPGLAAALADATHLLISIPADGAGDATIRLLGAEIAAAPKLGWIGYLSTIGVYGDAAGGWVDETTPTEPALWRTGQRILAEQQWLDLGRAAGRTITVFRLAGIYGPGRSAIDNLRAGTARRLVKPGYVSNRIHVDDIASVLEAALDRSPGHEIYNVTDDEPAPPQDVIVYAAGLLGVAPPPETAFADADLTPMAASFYATCKRVRNDRIKSDLGVRLAYPTYREGLRSILASGR